MQKVLLVLQACNFYISCSMESNLVADWWWTVWFDILFTFSQLQNLHPCCRIRTTKCVQRTIALYQYKLFTITIFCNRVLWGSYVQALDTISVIKIRDSFFLSQHAQPPLGLWLHTSQCEWINILLRTLLFDFCLIITGLRFSLHRAEYVLKEIQKTKNATQCDCSFFYLPLVTRLRFSLVYLCV